MIFQNITVQPLKWILHAADNNILQNPLILQEDVGVSEEMYGPIVPYFKAKQSATRSSMWNLS